MERTLDVDVDENGEPVLHNEPKVSAKTGKRRKGNPKAITRTMMKAICETIACGNYVKPSVLANGVSYSTFRDYMAKGKKGIRPYDEYYEMVEEAKAVSEVNMSLRIDESAKQGNVGADMWKLQRMFPNRWGNAQRQEIKVDNTQKITIKKFSDVNKDE